jgi:hypothetical protein
MTDRINVQDLILELRTQPSIEVLARHFPDRTLVHVVPWDVLYEEEQEVLRALLAGGHRKADYVEPFSIAAQVIVSDLEDLAMERGIEGCRIAHDMTGHGELRITMIFASLSDAVHFKLAMDW